MNSSEPCFTFNYAAINKQNRAKYRDGAACGSSSKPAYQSGQARKNILTGSAGQRTFADPPGTAHSGHRPSIQLALWAS
jgi:hypothetical protein